MKQLYDLSRAGLRDVVALASTSSCVGHIEGMDVVRPGSVLPLNYTFNTATRRNTSETYAHSLPVVTAEASAVVAEAGIVIGEAGIYVVSQC